MGDPTLARHIVGLRFAFSRNGGGVADEPINTESADIGSRKMIEALVTSVQESA
jgi:hypothetical protein